MAVPERVKARRLAAKARAAANDSKADQHRSSASCMTHQRHPLRGWSHGGNVLVAARSKRLTASVPCSGRLNVRRQRPLPRRLVFARCLRSRNKEVIEGPRDAGSGSASGRRLEPRWPAHVAGALPTAPLGANEATHEIVGLAAPSPADLRC